MTSLLINKVGRLRLPAHLPGGQGDGAAIKLDSAHTFLDNGVVALLGASLDKLFVSNNLASPDGKSVSAIIQILIGRKVK